MDYGLLEAYLVHKAGEAWDAFRFRGGRCPETEGLWALVRAAKLARLKGDRDLPDPVFRALKRAWELGPGRDGAGAQAREEARP